MLKPKTKEMLLPYINEENNGIRLGGFQYGIARDIEVDEPFKFMGFLKNLDGKKQVNQIAEESNLSIEETVDILNELKSAGVIYENDFNEFDFSLDESLYYDRNINFFAWIDTEGLYFNYWKVQSILKESRILLLGAGGTGGSCAISLARLGFGDITIVDYDTVELSNLNRQVFTYDQLGKSKAKSLKEILTKINPFIAINTEDKIIKNVGDLLKLGTDFDLVICCIDKPDHINDILEEYTQITGIPRILGGYASTILTNSIFTKDSGSYVELFKQDIEKNYDSKNVNQNMNNWQWNNAVISPVSFISGNFSSLYALYFVTKLKILATGEVNHIDLYNIQNDFLHIQYVKTA